jgi:CheY-like chemotaxis protein
MPINLAVNAEPHQRILVIDDNPGIHEDFRKIFGTGFLPSTRLAEIESALFGITAEADPGPRFEIDAVFNGHDGVMKLQQAMQAVQPYALVFVDGNMPSGWNGIETTQRLWQVCPHLPVVLCTAHSEAACRAMTHTLANSGKLAILRKPFGHQEVQSLARQFTGDDSSASANPVIEPAPRFRDDRIEIRIL